jgi:uncharacterized protein YqgV (UPF0045/DUF77 family)
MAAVLINAQVSAYPLRQQHLSPTIDAVTAALKAHGFQVEVGRMSTQISGEAKAVFAALEEAFMKAAETGQIVMTLTLSNACPTPSGSK